MPFNHAQDKVTWENKLGTHRYVAILSESYKKNLAIFTDLAPRSSQYSRCNVCVLCGLCFVLYHCMLSSFCHAINVRGLLLLIITGRYLTDTIVRYLLDITATFFLDITTTYWLDITAIFLSDITAIFIGQSSRNTRRQISMTWTWTWTCDFLEFLLVLVIYSAQFVNKTQCSEDLFVKISKSISFHSHLMKLCTSFWYLFWNQRLPYSGFFFSAFFLITPNCNSFQFQNKT